MEIIIYFQNKIVYDLLIHQDYFEFNKIDQETFLFTYAREILDNFEKRLPKKYSLTLFFYEVMDESIKHYEQNEQYEICNILLKMKLAVEDSTQRIKLNDMIIDEK